MVRRFLKLRQLTIIFPINIMRLLKKPEFISLLAGIGRPIASAHIEINDALTHSGIRIRLLFDTADFEITFWNDFSLGPEV